jgi:hypothetical protein
MRLSDNRYKTKWDRGKALTPEQFEFLNVTMRQESPDAECRLCGNKNWEDLVPWSQYKRRITDIVVEIQEMTPEERKKHGFVCARHLQYYHESPTLEAKELIFAWKRGNTCWFGVSTKDARAELERYSEWSLLRILDKIDDAARNETQEYHDAHHVIEGSRRWCEIHGLLFPEETKPPKFYELPKNAQKVTVSPVNRND